MKLTDKQFLHLIKELVTQEVDKRSPLLESPPNKARDTLLEQRLGALLKLRKRSK